MWGILRISEQEYETFRRHIKWTVDQGSALVQQREAWDGDEAIPSTSLARNAIRKSINSLRNVRYQYSRVDITYALAQWNYTSRGLESLSLWDLWNGGNSIKCFCTRCQRNHKGKAVLEKNHLKRSSSKTGKKSHNNRSRRWTESLPTIWKCHYDNSTNSESDGCDKEYVNCEHRNIQTKRQHEISSFRWRKKHHSEGLTVIKPSVPTLLLLMNYSYYLLMILSHVRHTDKSEKLREQVVTFKAPFEITKFRSDKPILVFNFLTTFVDIGIVLSVFEAHAFLVMPTLLNCRAKRH